jgi:hypothetical protein
VCYFFSGESYQASVANFKAGLNQLRLINDDFVAAARPMILHVRFPVDLPLSGLETLQQTQNLIKENPYLRGQLV